MAKVKVTIDGRRYGIQVPDEIVGDKALLEAYIDQAGAEIQKAESPTEHKGELTDKHKERAERSLFHGEDNRSFLDKAWNYLIDQADNIEGGGIKFLDGVTFGMGDEISGGVQSLVSGNSASEEIDRKRAIERQFSEDNPWISAGIEIAGAIPVGLNLAAKAGAGSMQMLGRSTPLSKQAGAGFLESAAYLAGEGEGGVGERVKNITDNPLSLGAGAVLPAALSGVGKGGGKLKEHLMRPELQSLRDKGIQPTVGQSLGGGFNRLEEVAQNIPGLGVRQARERAEEEFRKSFITDAMRPLGVTIKDGKPREMIKQAESAVDDAYDAMRAKMPESVVVDNGLRETLKASRSKIANEFSLNDKEIKRLNTFLAEEIYPLMRDGKLNKTDLQKIDTQLGSINKSNADNQLKEAYRLIRSDFSNWVMEKNPAYKEAGEKAREAFMGLSRVREAGKKAQNSKFTPGQAERAARKQDISASQGTTGEGLLQAEADNAANVLGNKVNDSGTFERLIGTGGMLTGLGGVVAGAPVLAPAAATTAAIGAGRIGSSRANQKRIVDALMASSGAGNKGSVLGMLSPILAEQEE